MNMCCCENTNFDENNTKNNLKVGDDVQLISSNLKDENTMYRLAQESKTIVYECLIRLNSKLRREIV